jgi:hypothetical protein
VSQELNVYRFAAAKQTAKGSVTAAPTKSFITVAGDLGAARDQGSEQWSDGATLYGGRTDWVNSVLGQGTPGIEFTPSEAAYLFWLFNGAETVAANAEKATLNDHTFVPGLQLPWYSTWWKKQGITILQRHRYADCLVGQLQIEGSTANKALRVSPTVLSLDPAENLAADPTWPALPTNDKVMLFTEAAGTFTIDTVVIRGHSQFTVVLNQALDAVFTDDITPFEVQRGTPAATIACTIQADADGLAQYNKYMYGTATPGAGAKPIRTLPSLGSYSFEAKKGAATTLAGRFKFTAPGVRWNPPDWPGPNPAGGNPTLALAGTIEPDAAADPLWTAIVTATDAAFTT